MDEARELHPVTFFNGDDLPGTIKDLRPRLVVDEPAVPEADVAAVVQAHAAAYAAGDDELAPAKKKATARD